MKNLLLLSILFIGLASCSDDDDNNNVLDPNAMISLRPEAGTKTSVNPEHLSALEIVKQAFTIRVPNFGYRGFSDAQRDTVNVRLLMFGDDVITERGSLELGFIEGVDIILDREFRDESGNRVKVDTIGYIKNSILRTAESQIKEAFKERNYAKCYEVFDKAFTFTPITGAEWRELKAEGKN